MIKLKETLKKPYLPKLILAGVLIIFLTAEGISSKKNGSLPKRETPPPKTTTQVPHVQIGVKPVPIVHRELFRRAFKLPGVENRPSIISLPGARGLWINDSINLVHPEIIIAGREFAHIHPDGSMHVLLDPKRAREAVKQGWAVKHPWAGEKKGWEGLVLLFTPQSMKELDVIFQLILDSYSFVTGRKFQGKFVKEL